MTTSDESIIIITGLTEKRESFTAPDSSFSFLEVPWERGTCEEVEVISQEERGTRATQPSHVIDPLFLSYIIEFPRKLEKVVKEVKNMNFRYEIRDLDFVRICDFGTNEVLLCIGAVDYTDIMESIELLHPLVFIFNRNRIKQKFRSQENRNYRNAIEKGISYKGSEDVIKKTNIKIIRKQIKNGNNVIFVENGEDVHREMKSILKKMGTRKIYIPKVRTFGESMKKGYLEYVIASIPGLGKCVGASLAEEFLSFKGFYDFLICKGKEGLCECLVWNEDRTGRRKLGKLQSQKIISVFLSGDGSLEV